MSDHDLPLQRLEDSPLALELNPHLTNLRAVIGSVVSGIPMRDVLKEHPGYAVSLAYLRDVVYAVMAKQEGTYQPRENTDILNLNYGTCLVSLMGRNPQTDNEWVRQAYHSLSALCDGELRQGWSLERDTNWLTMNISLPHAAYENGVTREEFFPERPRETTPQGARPIKQAGLRLRIGSGLVFLPFYP